MAFIEEILERTEAQTDASKRQRSVHDLKRMIKDAPEVDSFREALSGNRGIIAEVKRQSPSAGEMRQENFERAPEAYAKSPVVKAVSVLTNSYYFGMSIDQLARIRPLVRKPILRKDFITQEYQVYEARAFHADAILLMANLLTRNKLRKLFELARELRMDVLFEVHEKEEIEKLPDGAQICGVNSRKFMATKRWWITKKLVRFGIMKLAKAPDPSVELSTFSNLIKNIPNHLIKVAESGVKPNKVAETLGLGYDAALVGTSLLKAEKGVEKTLLEFEQALSPLQSKESTRFSCPEDTRRGTFVKCILPSNSSFFEILFSRNSTCFRSFDSSAMSLVAKLVSSGSMFMLSCIVTDQ